jgi:hypothetical protein
METTAITETETTEITETTALEMVAETEALMAKTTRIANCQFGCRELSLVKARHSSGGRAFIFGKALQSAIASCAIEIRLNEMN